jgi:dipeptidyl aminopeptidase/acylaminoacyl peptidase
MQNRFAIAVLAMAAAAPVAAQSPPSDRLTLDLYLEWERAGDPQIAPDGRQIVYTRGWVDKVNDRWESSLWIMNTDGSRNRFLVDGSNAQWSPDGTRIAFTARGEPQGNQIFVRWMDAEGATTQITRIEESPSALAWSPDGNWIAFTMDVDDRPDFPRVSLPDRPDGAKWTADPKVVTRLTYRRDRQGYIDGGYRHVFVVPATGGTPRQLTSGEWNHSAPVWTPDGTELLFSSLRVDTAEYAWRESEIYAVNVTSGAVRQLTQRAGPDGNPVVSPDGRLVAYTGMDRGDFTYKTTTLYVMDVSGANPRALTPPEFDQSPEDVTWAADNSGVYFTTQDRGTQNLHVVTLRGGPPRQVSEGNHLFSITTVTPQGLAVGTLTSPEEPGDIVTYDVKSRRFARLTGVNADVLMGRELGEVEEIWYTSLDDYRIQGWIVKPPDFDPAKKYPLMLSIHGGPHSMYGVGFNFGWQEHAANGYVVLYTNPRGSTGYGSAFGNAIKNAYPSKDYDDLMNGVNAVIAKGYVDTLNMFVYGCSGGGVLTSWIVGHTTRFAAASANCPVTNWFSFVGTTDGASWYRNFATFPWEDPTEHLRRSPIMYVGNVTTPTMLMTGEQDLRTPMGQTEEYYQALRVRKVPTAMVRFKNEWHGTSSTPSNFLRTQLYLRAWFERHKRTGAGVTE